MVAADSDRIPRVPPYSGRSPPRTHLPVRASHPLRTGFPDRFQFMRSQSTTAPTTPDPPRRTRFGLLPFRSPLLWESIFLSSPGGTKMFQFPPFAPASSRCQTFSLAGYPIRTSPDHFTLADPRGFSQLATSFVASGSLGIPRSLLFSFSLSEPDGRRASRHGPRPLLLFLTRCL